MDRGHLGRPRLEVGNTNHSKGQRQRLNPVNVLLKVRMTGGGKVPAGKHKTVVPSEPARSHQDGPMRGGWPLVFRREQACALLQRSGAME